MPYPHIIRLRGPWNFEVAEQVAGPTEAPCTGRATVPSDWESLLGNDFRGRVRYRRSFNPPATLDPHERLWLVSEGIDAFGRVSLNGRPLGTVDGYVIAASFDITELLAARNEIVLEVELPVQPSLRPGRDDLPGGPIGEVRLEIRSSWYIDSLAVWSDPGSHELVASGRIAGEAAKGPLAVVVSGCEREIAYFEATVGEPFTTNGAAEGFPVWTPEKPALSAVEIKLLSGGTAVWQTVLQTALRTRLPETAAALVDQLLPDSAYAAFDRTGRPVIQRVPRLWSDAVCSRLAHHPSIVAWSASSGREMPDTRAFGRRWI